MDETIARFFDKMPGAIPIYEAVTEMICDAFEKVEVRIQKTQITFSSKKCFAYVWLPIRKIRNRPEVYIILSFGLDRQIVSQRVVQSVEAHPKRWIHHVIIQKPSDLDEEMKGWLYKAYAFAQR